MNNKILGIVVVLAVIVVGGFYYFNGGVEISDTDYFAGNENDESSDVTEPTQSGQIVPGESPVGGDMQVFQTKTVTYTGSEFSPSSITISKGDAVTWVNQSPGSMWIASAAHPTHAGYDGTSFQEHCGSMGGDAFDQCEGGTPGTSWTFTFDKVGEWKYHDHLKLGAFGTVIVE